MAKITKVVEAKITKERAFSVGGLAWIEFCRQWGTTEALEEGVHISRPYLREFYLEILCEMDWYARGKGIRDEAFQQRRDNEKREGENE